MRVHRVEFLNVHHIKVDSWKNQNKWLIYVLWYLLSIYSSIQSKCLIEYIKSPHGNQPTNRV